MLMLLERRGYNSRAARVSGKEVSQGWRNSKYKVMRKGICYGLMREHSELLGQAYGTISTEGSIKEKGGDELMCWFLFTFRFTLVKVGPPQG